MVSHFALKRKRPTVAVGPAKQTMRSRSPENGGIEKPSSSLGEAMTSRRTKRCENNDRYPSRRKAEATSSRWHLSDTPHGRGVASMG